MISPPQEALRRCTGEYFPKIYNYIFYRILSKEDTEDIVSEIFTKTARSADAFDSKRLPLIRGFIGSQKMC